MSNDECNNGKHCDCAACPSGCYYYDGKGTPNACFSGWSWKCGAVPKGPGGGAIAGIVIACVVVVGAAVGGFFWWRKRNQKGYEQIRG